MANKTTSPRTLGQMEADISQAIVKFEKQYMGRGPNEIRSHILDDLVIVRLRGILTAAEQELAKTGGLERGTLLVKSVRTELLEKARPLLESLINGITGRKVVSMHTDLSTKVGERLLVFVLDAPVPPAADPRKNSA
jgi:uncharacterized protein YbcI